MVVKIKNKTVMHAMLRMGKFGNTLRTWDTEAEYLASGFRGLTSLRSRCRGVPFRYGFSHEVALCEGRKHYYGYGPTNFIYCESLPLDDCVFQGELRRGLYGLELLWSTKKLNHQVAMRTAKQTFGIQANAFLKCYLDAVDYDDLVLLLDLYDDHGIEFTVCRYPVGHLGRRMIVWEVRAY